MNYSDHVLVPSRQKNLLWPMFKAGVDEIEEHYGGVESKLLLYIGRSFTRRLNNISPCAQFTLNLLSLTISVEYKYLQKRILNDLEFEFICMAVSDPNLLSQLMLGDISAIIEFDGTDLIIPISEIILGSHRFIRKVENGSVHLQPEVLLPIYKSMLYSEFQFLEQFISEQLICRETNSYAKWLRQGSYAFLPEFLKNEDTKEERRKKKEWAQRTNRPRSLGFLLKVLKVEALLNEPLSSKRIWKLIEGYNPTETWEKEEKNALDTIKKINEELKELSSRPEVKRTDDGEFILTYISKWDLSTCSLAELYERLMSFPCFQKAVEYNFSKGKFVWSALLAWVRPKENIHTFIRDFLHFQNYDKEKTSTHLDYLYNGLVGRYTITPKAIRDNGFCCIDCGYDCFRYRIHFPSSYLDALKSQDNPTIIPYNRSVGKTKISGVPAISGTDNTMCQGKRADRVLPVKKGDSEGAPYQYKDKEETLPPSCEMQKVKILKDPGPINLTGLTYNVSVGEVVDFPVIIVRPLIATGKAELV